MNWKEFLKPDFKKIIIFAIIIILLFLLSITIYRSYPSTGYPLPIQKVVSLGEPGRPVMLTAEYDYINILINLVIWYLISCVIIFIYNKYKK